MKLFTISQLMRFASMSPTDRLAYCWDKLDVGTDRDSRQCFYTWRGIGDNTAVVWHNRNCTHGTKADLHSKVE